MATLSISGISSGVDWRSMIDQLRNIEYSRIKLIQQEKATFQARISAWQGINTKLLSLKTAAEKLNRSSDFDLFKTALTSGSQQNASDVLSAAAGSGVAPGTYEIVVKSVATAQRLSSDGHASASSELGLTGDMLVGGRSVNIRATDTLRDLRDKINAVNTGSNASGVTASIVDYGVEGFRLILSGEVGTGGIPIRNGGSQNLLGALGFVDASSKTPGNALAGGHRSEAFSSSDSAVGGGQMLNLADPQIGSVAVTINGHTRDVTIDLASDSLNDIRDAINAAFSGTFTSDPASVLTETRDGSIFHRLFIEGAAVSYTDHNNVLETLGVLSRRGVSDVRGVTGDVANTSSGLAVTAATKFNEIDGYIDITPSDTITLSGVDTNGNSVNTVFSVFDGAQYKDVGQLLREIESAFGNVTASMTTDGRLRVVDNEIGGSGLSVVLSPQSPSLAFAGEDNLGAVDTIRKRELQAGSNAEITVDGVTVRPSSNTVTDIIEGVTLNLRSAAPDTVITLNVERDNDEILDNIKGFVDAYNSVMDSIRAQMSYDQTSGKAGGPLFGDSSLRTLRSTLSGIVLNKVPGVANEFSSLALVGVSIGSNGKLTLNESRLRGHLEDNFDDVRRLFSASWSSTDSRLSYAYHSRTTQAGAYEVNITGVDPLDGHFFEPGDAEGRNNTLRGLSGNVEGLGVSYAGTSTGLVGTFTLTFGIAELFERSLQGLTDRNNGFIASKEDSIRGTVDRLDNRMAQMEVRIDRQMEIITGRFMAMESAMATLQSQSQWLSMQLTSIM